MKDYEILDDLVPKTQELHRAIFDKGYEQGFDDGIAWCLIMIDKYEAESEEEK